ncbi:hypothetical protein PRVXT_000277 [Proteinivorax tanatarense]|uniref:Cell division protein FtsL n=1 Tax=Proteinivorax tanatarense TaxID=1260629 RepID=A0AAU7VM85_9FIRM
MNEHLNIVVVPSAHENTKRFKVSYKTIKRCITFLVLFLVMLSFLLVLYRFEHKNLQAQAEQGKEYARANSQLQVEIQELNKIIDDLIESTQILEENLKEIEDLKERTSKK